MKYLILLAIPFGALLGDGIPVDENGRVTSPHTVVAISESQAEEIETLGTLTLSVEQWQKLRAIRPSFPKRIEYVLPVTWGDCTCDMDPYVIQISRNEIAATHDGLVDEAHSCFQESLGDPYNDIYLRTDRRGQFYYQGVLISFPKLIELVAASSGKRPEKYNEKHRWMCVEMPLGITRDSAVVKSRLDKLFQVAARAQWATPDSNPDKL